MSAHESPERAGAASPIADPPTDQQERVDRWITEIEGRIEDLETRIRQMSLAGQSSAREGFTLQKLLLLLGIIREVKGRL